MAEVKTIIKQNKKIFSASKKVKNTNKTLGIFFNGSSMARILDIFLDNPDSRIGLSDFIRLGISRSSMENNIPILKEMDVIDETFIAPFKFYSLIRDNTRVKHLEDLRDILSYGSP